MRIVRAIQSASALAGAIFITFNQPNREITGTDWIGLIALIIVGLGWLAANIVAFFTSNNKKQSWWLLVIAAGLALVVLIAVQNLDAKYQAFELAAHLFATLVVCQSVALLIIDRSNKAERRENLIAVILAAALSLVLMFGSGQIDEVSILGFFNTFLIFSAVHLGISAATPKA
ncbi:MAG: hypothetical protein RLZZ258_1323 [Actinomycetota bacterium]